MDGSAELNRLSGRIIDRMTITFAAEVPMALEYEGLRIDHAYRLDLLVADLIIVEIKAVDTVLPVHRAQLLTYLKLSGKPLGIFFNFNSKRLSDDLKRIANGL